jgi:hypothetical protein
LKISSPATALLVLAASGCATARWEEFGWSDNSNVGGHIFQYDAASLKHDGDIVSGTQMISYEATHKVTRSRFYLDCRARRIQFKGTSVEYAGRILSKDRTGPSRWSQIASGTIAGTLANRVCNFSR